MYTVFNDGRALVKRVALLCAAALLMASPALAADLPARMPIKAPVVAPVSWTGWFGGVSIGARWADVDGETISWRGGPPPFPALAQQGYDSTTFRGGGYLGYNWQLDPTWLVGLEGDIAWGDGSTRVDRLQGLPVNIGNFSEFRHTWDGGIRGRVGYLFAPTWLLYATGGVQWQQVEATVNCAAATCTIAPFNQTNDTTLVGWTVGGGIETLLWDHWLARVEYRYADYGTWRTSFGPPSETIVKDFAVNTQTAFVGLARKF